MLLFSLFSCGLADWLVSFFADFSFVEQMCVLTATHEELVRQEISANIKI